MSPRDQILVPRLTGNCLYSQSILPAQKTTNLNKDIIITPSAERKQLSLNSLALRQREQWPFRGGYLWLRLHDKEQSQPMSSLLKQQLSSRTFRSKEPSGAFTHKYFTTYKVCTDDKVRKAKGNPHDGRLLSLGPHRKS